MRKTLPMTGLPEDFQLTEKTIAAAEAEHPTLDIQATLVKFKRKAEAVGWMYKSWQAAFLNYCDNIEKFGGGVYKVGRVQDPKWIPILAEARKYGFREPTPAEPTPGSYRTAFEYWKSGQRVTETVLPFPNPLKKFG